VILKAQSQLKSLVEISNNLLLKDFITDDEFLQYKKDCEVNFSFLISQNLNYTITELAKSGLNFKVKEIKNPFIKVLSLLFIKDRFCEPYLNGGEDQDCMKEYVFWTKARLEGIILNQERIAQ